MNEIILIIGLIALLLLVFFYFIEPRILKMKVKNDNEMYPPFSSIDGLGDTVAQNIVAEREKKEF